MTKIQIFFIFIAAGLLLASGRAYSERAAGDCPRVPVLLSEEALEAASRQLKQTQNIEEFFVDSILLKCENDRDFWEIGWRRKAYESGHFVIKVFTDGSIETKIVKDG